MRPDDPTDRSAQQARRERRREVAFEEGLRSAVACLVVIFVGGLLVALPFVAPWMLGATLLALLLRVPTAVVARAGSPREPGPEDPVAARWTRAYLGVMAAALLGGLLLVWGADASLGGVLWQAAAAGVVLGVLVRARLRAWPFARWGVEG